jgi:hypothetical protein
LVIEAPRSQRIIEAAPAAAVHRLQAQVGQGDDRIGRQQSIAQLEQGIGASMEAPVEVGAKRAERCEGMIGHAAQLARFTRRRPA